MFILEFFMTLKYRCFPDVKSFIGFLHELENVEKFIFQKMVNVFHKSESLKFNKDIELYSKYLLIVNTEHPSFLYDIFIMYVK